MIAVNELRIGNLVHFNNDGLFHEIRSVSRDKIHPIELIELDGSNGYAHNCELSEIEPIPITEALLEKSGWKWNGLTSSFERYPDTDSRMHLRFVENNSSYTMFNYIRKCEIVKRIWHVHQLQNLYFALTGREIKIIK